MAHILDQLIPLNKIDQLYYQAQMALFAAGLTGLVLSMLGLALQGILHRAGTWLKKYYQPDRGGWLERLNTGFFGG